MSKPTIGEYRAAAPHPRRRQGGRRTRGDEIRGAAGTPVITVVTVVRNAREALGPTLESVFDQGYEALEYIVVDGASTDGTLDVVEANDERLAYWLSEPDGGIYDAMNKGIAAARGEVVGLLNAGDLYTPGTLAAVAEAFRAGGTDRIYCGDTLIHYLELDLRIPTAADLGALHYTASLPHPSVFVPRRIYEADGLYDLRYRLASDYAYLASQLFAGQRFHHIERPLSVFVNDGRSSSRAGFFQCRREIVAFHRRARSGHAVRAAVHAGFEISLFLAYSLFKPVLGTRAADAWKRRYFHWRQRRRQAPREGG